MNSLSAIVTLGALVLVLSIQPATAQLPNQNDRALESAKDLKLVAKLEGLTNHVYVLSFSADGKRVVVFGTDQ